MLDPSLDGATITIPGEVFRLLVDVLNHMKDGHPLTILPTQAELTTQQASDILGVSRPYLVKLLDEGKIPSRKVGVYRRVLAVDVLRYKQITDQLRQQVLDELVKEAQDLGMGY
ncbi:helix-turn-helix domain-containing protein [Aetokthonos hydrillicola Thurmond2011]|uniref:Helix-turn-helix domain-containing protein n=1 Tax=Aetokthonos hydrillicola Thurmond2011 TaxID=2712845 RepID=A0AAP5I9I4_9CYAN|nr:helix-turn-helix domain-containing protein [Aetokthonos hydrillicola]MDR9896052.1 helix-turn-helix domain-containing protein [Aetokthonos hydrillicola Thurmond2011]